MLDTNKLIPNRSTKSSLSPVAMTNFIVLKTDLVKIDSILKEKLVLSKVRSGIERQMIQNKRRKEREAELEKKKNKKEEEINIDSDPKKTKGGGGLAGFLIGSLIAGIGAIVVSALPTFIKIGKLIAKVARPIISMTGALLNMFGKLVSNTFKAIRNVQDNFPLDKVQQIPKIVATIGAGIAGLVGAMATFSAANAVIGAISARSLKQVVEATKKQQLLGSGTIGGRLTVPQSTALSRTTRTGDIRTTGAGPIGKKGRTTSQQIEFETMLKTLDDNPDEFVIKYGDEIKEIHDTLIRTKYPFGVDVIGTRDTSKLITDEEVFDETYRFFKDLISDEGRKGLTEEAGSPSKWLKNFFESEENFGFLKFSDMDENRQFVFLDQLDKNPRLGESGLFEAIIGEKPPVVDVGGQGAITRAATQTGADITGDVAQRVTTRGGTRITGDVVSAIKPLSGTGDDAGALARQVLKNKQATKIVTKVLKKPILQTFKTTARQTLGAVPLLGDLAVLMLDIFVFGETPPRAGFKTIGSIMGAFLGGFLGSLLPGPGTIVGAIIGGIAGDIIGGKIYDFLDVSSRKSEVYQTGEGFGGDTSRDVSATDLSRAGLSGFADFATVKDLGGEIGKGMVFKNMENKPEFLLEGDLYEEFKDRGFGAVLSTANALQGRGFEYLRTQLSYEKKRGRKTRFIPIGLPSQTSNPMVASTVQVIGSPDPSLVLNSLNRQILYKRG